MKALWKNTLALAVAAIAAPAWAQVTFYERPGFSGQSFTTDGRIGNLERFGFNDRASSAVVLRDHWEVCEEVGFAGRCIILRPGRYPSLAAMGLNDRISSVRTVSADARLDEHRYAPPPPQPPDYQRVRDERLYQADVISVHAVLGPPDERCWVEHEQVTRERSDNSIPGTIAGALIGGILGHQIGNGRGQSLATAGGAVAGAVVGNNIGRGSGGEQTTTQDVRRCSSTPSQARTEFWDVAYNFRGEEHHLQTTAPPGATITVNERGEPRL